MNLSPLRVGNENFLVTSMIERCPRSMMLRELVKNALESAATAPEGRQRVEIAPVLIDGIRKLSIWNTGTGMTADELYRMCDIASSIGKVNGLEQNFGMGAKVASLPSNPLGIRYRSCRDGIVHQVMMGKRGEAYGRLHAADADGEARDVLDVTAQAAADGRALDCDWTEVVLMGHRAEQDTVTDPYNGDPGMARDWIAHELYLRFFTLPAGIDLVLRDGCHILGGDRRFLSLAARSRDFAHYEAVPAEHGVVIHYFHDAPDPDAPENSLTARGALQPARSGVALVYRDEIYDLQSGWEWQHAAPAFGIPYGARQLSILVELPDNFSVLPDGYRQFLRHSHNLQHHIRVREFAGMAFQYRPEWLLALLDSFAPDSRHTDHLGREIAELFRSLGIRRRSRVSAARIRSVLVPSDDGVQTATTTTGEGGQDAIEYEVAPQISVLRDARDIEERGLENKAARFYLESHQLFINATYAGFTDFSRSLENEFAHRADQEDLRRTATIVAEQLLIREICRKLVYGLSKQGIWHHWEVEQATSMYSLTLAVDDSGPVLPEGRSAMERELAQLAATSVGAA